MAGNPRERGRRCGSDQGGEAGGKITFTLVGPNDCTRVPTGFTAIDVTVAASSPSSACSWLSKPSSKAPICAVACCAKLC